MFVNRVTDHRRGQSLAPLQPVEDQPRLWRFGSAARKRTADDDPQAEDLSRSMKNQR